MCVFCVCRFWMCCVLCVCVTVWRFAPIRIWSVIICCPAEICCYRHDWSITSTGKHITSASRHHHTWCSLHHHLSLSHLQHETQHLPRGERRLRPVQEVVLWAHRGPRRAVRDGWSHTSAGGLGIHTGLLAIPGRRRGLGRERCWRRSVLLWIWWAAPVGRWEERLCLYHYC